MDIALAVGVEKMNVVGQANPLALFDGGFDVPDPGALDKALLLISGFEPDPDVGARSVFMDIYAAVARAHMTSFGTTQHQLATVSAKNHRHSVENDRAHFRRDLWMEQILASRELCHPLTVPMCAPMTDGAAAVLCAPLMASACRMLGRSAAFLRAGQRYRSRLGRLLPACGVAGRQTGFEAAGVGPHDIDVAEVHDATASASCCRPLSASRLGRRRPLAASGATQLGGRLPVNTSGGLESRATRSARPDSARSSSWSAAARGRGQRQVQGARLGLAENGGLARLRGGCRGRQSPRER